MSRIVRGEIRDLIEPFELFFLYTHPKEEHGRFVDCLYQRESIAISLLQCNYHELPAIDDVWLNRLKFEYTRFIQAKAALFEDTSIDVLIQSMIGCSKWKQQVGLLNSITWKPGTLGHVISSLERCGFAYSSFSNVKHFDQDGLGATMITSNEDETIIYSNSELNFLDKSNQSRIKRVIEQAIPGMLVVMENPKGQWCMFELDRRSLLGLESGSSSHIHFSSNLKYRGEIEDIIVEFKNGNKMNHGHTTHVVYSNLGEALMTIPISCSVH